MPQVSSLSLNDGQATPVARTFTLYTSQVGPDKPASFMEKSAGSVNGYRHFTALVRIPQKGGTSKISIRIICPVLEQVSGTTSNGYTPAARVAYTTLANLEFVLPERCTLQDRKDILAFLGNAVTNTSVKTMIEQIEPFS